MLEFIVPSLLYYNEEKIFDKYINSIFKKMKSIVSLSNGLLVIHIVKISDMIVTTRIVSEIVK